MSYISSNHKYKNKKILQTICLTQDNKTQHYATIGKLPACLAGMWSMTYFIFVGHSALINSNKSSDVQVILYFNILA